MKPLFAVLAAAAALSLAGGPAHAQTFKELMEDIGIQKRKQTRIDFSERAPLVLPPSLDTLPPPEDGGSLAAVNPNWPSDPDDVAAAEQAEIEKIPQHLRRKHKENPAEEIYEAVAKEREQPSPAVSPKPYDTVFDRDRVLSPDELKEVRDKRAAQPEVNVYVEPPRKRLTDPPAGYRAPSAAQPFGPGEKEKKKGFLSKINPFD